jgi:hypothetical protein
MPAPPLEWSKSSHHRCRGGAPSSRSRCRHRCRRGVDVAGREQEVEGHDRLHALASMRVPSSPAGEGALGSSPAPLRLYRRRRPSGSYRRRSPSGSWPCSIDRAAEDVFLCSKDQELAAHRHALGACRAPGACHAYERDRARENGNVCSQ